MKDKKTFLMGFIACITLLLIMGASRYNEGNGKYQMIEHVSGHALYLLDTETSEVYVYSGEADKTWKKKLAPISD